MIKEFSETDGMIIDLRQYPSYQAAWLIQGEITDEGSKTAYLQLNPVGYYPGAYSVRDFEAGSSLPGYQGKYSDRPVVVIIDEQTMSMPEFFTMIYRTNENVTILGNPSAGCDGERRGFQKHMAILDLQKEKDFISNWYVWRKILSEFIRKIRTRSIKTVR